MSSAFLLFVRLHDRRYHGRPEWPPSPARVFQALVAGSARGNALPREDRDALAWLEHRGPPVIAAPAARRGQYFKHFMPNNDFDAVGGDPNRIAKIRTATKVFHPYIFD